MSGLIAALAYFAAIGTAIHRGDERETHLERLALRYLLGLGVVGIYGHLAGAIRLPLTTATYLLPWISAVIIVIRRRRSAETVTATPEPRSSIALTAAVVMSIPVAVAILQTFAVPLGDYDGRTFWMLKARAIAHEESLTGPFFRGETSRHPHSEYPLLMPISSAVVFKLTSSDDDRTARWVFTLTAIAFLVTLRRLLRTVSSANVSAVVVSAVAWLPQFAIETDGGAASAYADIPVAAFTTVALTFIARGELAVPQLAISLASLPLIKNEGAVIALVLAACALALGNRDRLRFLQRSGSLTLFAIVILSAWRAAVPLEHDENYPHLLRSIGETYGRAPTAMRELLSRMLDVDRWGLFWAIALVALPLAWKRSRRLTFNVVAAATAIAATYVLMYTVTNWNIAELANSSANRLLMHVVPFAAIVLATSAAPVKSKANPAE